MLCELSLLFNKEERVEEHFLEVTENSLFEKLWHHLDKRELRDFGSTNTFSTPSLKMYNRIWLKNNFVNFFLLLVAPLHSLQFVIFRPMARGGGGGAN